MKMLISRIKQYLNYKLMSAVFYQDADYLYRRGGITEVIRYLRICPSAHMTRDILVKFGAKIDPSTKYVGPYVYIHMPRYGTQTKNFENLTIGANVHIGNNLHLDLSDRITIEDNVHIGMYNVLLTHFNIHTGNPSTEKPLARAFRAKEAAVVLKRGSVTAASVIIACGVEVGEDSMIGAGIFVEKSIAKGTFVRSNQQLPDYKLHDRWFR
jgi:acetyltransferase-like isoleucine patch superfamily enzyme